MAVGWPEKQRDGVSMSIVRPEIAEQEWQEWKEVNWYGNDPLVKTGIPSGKFCNPSMKNWCPYCVSDYCLKYEKKLFTHCRMSMEFHGQLKSDICRKEHPKGLDVTQLNILDNDF
jgi:hypothetical protein